MVNFVEQASLVLKADQAIREANKVTAALNTMNAAASKLKSKKIDIGGLSQADTKVKNLTRDIQRLQAQGAKGIRIPVTGGGGGSGRVPNVGGGSGGGRGDTPRVRIEIDPLRTLLNSAITRMGTAIENALINGVKKGFSQQDVADTRGRLLGQTPAEQAVTTEAGARVARRQRVVTNAQGQMLVTENIPITRGNQQQAEFLANQQADFVALAVAQGQSADAAAESAVKYSKVADQVGALSDAAGNFDASAATEFFGFLKASGAVLGKEIDAALIATTFRNARVSKQTLGTNVRGTGTLLQLAEESGPSAAVGLNQLIKQLGGTGVAKAQFAKQAEIGLITTKEVTIGGVGGKPQTRTVVDKAVDEELRRTDTNEFVTKNIIPAMRREGLDPNNAVDAANFAGKVVSDRTAIDTLTTLILRNQDIDRTNDQIEARNRTFGADQQGIIDKSALVSFQEVSSQATNLLGQIANSLKGTFVPALEAASSVLNGLSNLVAGGTPEGNATALGGTALAGLGAFKAGTAIMGKLNPFSASATALTGSATALNSAAAALTRAAIASGASNAPGGIGGAMPRTGQSPSAKLPQGLTGGLIGTISSLAVGSMVVTDAAFQMSQATDMTKMTPEQKEKTAAEGRIKQVAQDASANRAIEGFLDATIGKSWTDFLVKRQSEFEAELKPAVAKSPAAVAAEQATVKQADQTEAQRLTTEITKLTTQIQTNKANEKIPGTSDIVNSGLETQKQTLTMQLQSLTQANTNFATTFDTGAQQINNGINNGITGAIPTLTQAGSTFGQNANAGINARALGAEMAAGFNASVRVPAAAGAGNTIPASPAANTGALQPVE